MPYKQIKKINLRVKYANGYNTIEDAQILNNISSSEVARK